ncbi:MAG TPA: serine/threonine-protein kinase [Kofleriaceae bacterium]
MVTAALGSDSKQALPELTIAPARGDPTLSATPTASLGSQPPLAANQVRDPARYQILCEHGRGGLGRVSRAHDRSLGRDVAIKELISPGHVGELRFVREALITARLEHPGIVPVHEAGRWPDGTPFYAMKLVAGRPLRDLIAERTTVDQRIGLLHHVIAVADAIAYAHGRNIIHRDLKPANIIVGDFGETIVIDWGLAKDLSAGEESTVNGGPFRAPQGNDLTAAGAVLGTPSYMPPEQERGEHVDQRADVFAIGAMLWELCSLYKVPPREAHARHRLLRQAHIDEDLMVIIDKALDPDPGRRYAHAGALAADLKAFKSGARISARRYSMFAMLVHWSRRHRALVASLVGALAVIIAVTVLYVRSVSAERDRADAARAEAEHERRTAALERDRAQLSEASLVLEKDPTHARELLRSTESRNPQRAMLLAKAESRSALRAIHLDSRIHTMRAIGVPLDVAVVTANGEFMHLDLDSGALRAVDRGLAGPLTPRDGHWCYAKESVDMGPVVLSGCGVAPPLGTLLRSQGAQLVSAAGALYLLEAGALYRLETSRAVRLHERVRGLEGSNRVLAVCSEDGRLQITRDNKLVVSSTCPSNESAWPIAASDEHYVALQSPTTLLSERGVIPLPAKVPGEYGVALGDHGLIAFVDMSGGAWIARPGKRNFEPAAQRAAHPTGVAAMASVVAFGYADGAVVVVDAELDQRWELLGHNAPVTQLVVDATHRRIVSGADNELRIWDLRPPQMSTAAALPCSPFHVVPTDEQRTFATDCSDGRAVAWTLGEHSSQVLHTHRDLAFGVAMNRGQVCTASWDGRVLCTPTGGGETREALVNPDRVRALASCPNSDLFAATSDGAVWRLGRESSILYRHRAIPYRIDTNASCTRLASGAYDGSLIVYDLADNRIITELPHAHGGQITNVVFQGNEVVTSSVDATVKRWHVGASVESSGITTTTGPVNKLRVLRDGWAASVSDRTFVLAATSSHSEIRLAFGHPIADIAISSDERYVAVAGLDEIVVLDRERDMVATVHHAGGYLACVQFISINRLAACDTSAILTLHLDRLQFFAMNTDSRTSL